jgi:putative membrane protein
MAFGQDARLVVSRRGLGTRRLDIVPQERVQSVRLSQGPLDRLFRMVRIHVDSPPGPVSVVGSLRDADEGRALLRASIELSRAARVSGADVAQLPVNGSAGTPTDETTQ